MGGWHIAHRSTNNDDLIGIVSNIRLPNRCGCQNDDYGKYNGVFLEFIHGFYKSCYGIDIGIVYRNEKFQIFYHALNGTCEYSDPTPSNPPVILDVNKGDLIILRSYINRNGQSLVSEVIKDEQMIGKYETYFTKQASKAYIKGARINREIVMAANRKNYIPTNAFFSDTKMFNTMLTNRYYEHIKLSKSNSKLKCFSDENNMDSSKYGIIVTKEDGYINDMGSCDFRGLKNLSGVV